MRGNTIKHYYKMRANIRNPARMTAVSQHDYQLYISKHKTAPFGIRAVELLKLYGIDRGGLVQPLFNYDNIVNPNLPTWKIEPPEINLSLTRFSKSRTTVNEYKMAFTRFKYDNCRTKKSLQQSTDPGRWILNVPGNGDKPCYMEDPQIIPQKWGANLRTNTINLNIDLESFPINLFF